MIATREMDFSFPADRRLTRANKTVPNIDTSDSFVLYESKGYLLKKSPSIF